MAIPASTYVYGYGTGTNNREDLMDMVSIIDPWEAPLFLASPKKTVNHVTVEWLVDSLGATSTAAAAEGADFSQSADAVARTRRQNVTQIFRRDILVTNTQRAVNPAGVRDEYEYQIEKALKEIARNIECGLFMASAASAVGTTATARQWKGLAVQHTTNVDTMNSSALGIQNLATLGGLSASATLMTEDRFNAMLELIFNNGGNPDTAYVNAATKRQISNFVGPASILGAATTQHTVTSRNIGASEKKIIASIDVYDSDFGMIQIVMDRWIYQPANVATNHTDYYGRAWFIETGMVQMGILRPIRHVPLAAVGDSTRGMVLGELTNMVINEKANGCYWGVSNFPGAQQ